MTTPTAEAGASAGVAALVQAEASLLAQIGNNVAAGLLRLWRQLGSFYVAAEVAEFGAEAGALVVAAQQLAGEVTEQHLFTQLAQLGAAVPAGPVVGLPTDLRFGAMTADVYQRPVQTVRYLTSLAGPGAAPTAEAVAAGERRIRKLAETDLQLARTTAAQQVMYETDDVRGFRRVIHPELSRTGEGTCGMCIVAADRVYGRLQLLPLHPGCHCTVLPIIGRNDPGRTLNSGDLQRIYATAGSNRAADLRKTRIQVTEHGELGPVLSLAKHHTRDQRDVQRANSTPTEEQRRRSLETQRQALRAQLDRQGLSTGQASWLGDRLDQLEQLLLSN